MREPIPFVLWADLPVEDGMLPAFSGHTFLSPRTAGDVARGIRAAFVGKPYLRERFKAGLALRGMSLSAFALDVWRQVVTAHADGKAEIALMAELAGEWRAR